MADHYSVGVVQDKIGKNKNHKTNKRASCKDKKKGLKVVYISSPMKFNTCASKFRALVQELTGKDSDAAAQYMDPVEEAEGSSSPTARTTVVVDDHYYEDHRLRFGDQHDLMLNYDQESSPTCTSSDSVFDDEGNLVLPGGSFLDLFTSLVC